MYVLSRKTVLCAHSTDIYSVYFPRYILNEYLNEYQNNTLWIALNGSLRRSIYHSVSILGML